MPERETENQERLDLQPAVQIAEEIFLDTKDKIIGTAKILTGSGLGLAGLCLTVVNLPGGVILAATGGWIFSKGVEQAIFKSMDR